MFFVTYKILIKQLVRITESNACLKHYRLIGSKYEKSHTRK